MSLVQYLPRFRRARKAIDTMGEREDWSRQQIDVFQLDRVNALWQHATESVPYYRELAARLSLPKSFASVEEFTAAVPVLTKDTVRDEPSQFVADAPEPGTWRTTGGSTGTPTRVYWPFAAHENSLHARYRSQDQWGIDLFDRHAMVWGHAHSFAPGVKGIWGRFRTRLEDRLRKRLRLSAYRLSPSDVDRYLQRILRGRIRWIYGYSSAIYILAERALQLGMEFPHLELIMVSGEPAYPWIVAQSERAFQAPTIAEYGSMECGNLAHEGKDRRLRVREDRVLMETVENEQGKFDILVTCLDNRSFPLIRFAIGDLATEALERPSHGFAVLPGVSGRTNDMVVAQSGRLVHPMGLKHVFERYREIRRFTARQDITGHVRVQVESPSKHLDLSTAERQLSELVEGFGVTVEQVDVIQGTAAGKHRWIVSELANAPADCPR